YTGQRLADGAYTVSATATDVAGNSSSAATHTLLIDTVAPTGSFTIAGAKLVNGQLATNALTATVQPAFSDGGSGVARMAFSTDGRLTRAAWQTYASSAAVPLPSADGLYTVSVRVMDVAGNAVVSSQAVRVTRTGPTVTTTQTAPTNNGSYDVGGTLVVTYSASDTLGVASISATLDPTTGPGAVVGGSALAIASGTALKLYTLAPGAHTVVVRATDVLGNLTTTIVAFQVHATVADLVGAVNYGVANLLVSSLSQSSLLAPLNAAAAALAAGNS